MTVSSFDAVVVGTGPAGSSVATELAERGWSVAIAESREFGGTCALRGCNPKKVYTNAGAVIDLVRHTQDQLVVGDGVRIDWPTLYRFKQQFTRPVVERKEASLRKRGIETLHGRASFADPSTLRVGDRQVRAKQFVIATGACPRKLEIAGEDCLIHSDVFLDREDLPGHVAFIGGGYVSMEFAHVVARSGRKVTVIEQAERILAGFDPDLVEQLTEYSRGCGIHFRLATAVTGVEQKADGSKTVQFSGGDCLPCDLVVHGAGRVPNLEHLNLQAGNVEATPRGIAVDEYLCSRSNPAVHALGDCAATASPPLTPVANRDAEVVVRNLLAGRSEVKRDSGPVPKAAFTTPSIAAVGLSQREAAERGLDVEIRSGDRSGWGSVRKVGSPAAGFKILIDRATRQIVGAHVLGPAAEETINLFALAMRFGVTADQFQAVPFVFPTFSSDAGSMC